MRNSWKLGVGAALCCSVAFVGCGDDDGDDDNEGGSSGSTAGGKAGQNTGGSSAGLTNGGNAGKGGSGGTPGAGKGGAGGGTAGKGGSAGSAGSDNGVGGAAGGQEAGGAGGNAGDLECTDAELGAGGSGEGGAGGAATVTTAVVLLDSVSVKKAAAATKDWLFADGTTISDETNYPADKWSRIVFDAGSLGDEAGCHISFLACDGDPADGSLKNVVPFTDANQYYELGVPFAAADLSNNTITARIKLVSGGKPDAGCPVRGELYVTGTTNKTGPALPLILGTWITLTLELADGFTATDRVGLRLNTYGC